MAEPREEWSCEHCGFGTRDAPHACDHCGSQMCERCTDEHDENEKDKLSCPVVAEAADG